MAINHLVTRPVVDQEPFASELRALGRNVIFDPVIDISFNSNAIIDLENVQAILFTSANGVRAYQGLCNYYTLPAFCVGDSSAHEAQRAGFDHIYSANGDVSDLAALVGRTLDVGKGALFHPAASKLAGDLQGLLVQKGYGYRREVLYDAKSANHLGDNVINLFKNNQIQEISFFSPRSAKVFLTLLEKEGLKGELSGVSLYCLSKAVADKFKNDKLFQLSIAAEPTRVELLKLLSA